MAEVLSSKELMADIPSKVLAEDETVASGKLCGPALTGVSFLNDRSGRWNVGVTYLNDGEGPAE